MIEAQAADFAGAVLHRQCQVLAALELRHEIDGRILPPVDLTLRQCRRCGGRIGNEIPHHTIDIDDLRTGIETRLAVLARHIFVVLHIDDTLAGNALRRDELEWAAADRLGDLLHRIGLRQPLRHDGAIHLPERIRQQRKRLLQPEADHLVRRRRNLVGTRHQGAAEWIALGKRWIVATQSRASTGMPSWNARPSRECQIPLLAVIADDMAVHHLRLHIEVRIIAIQRIIHGKREVARDVRRGPDRIERGEVRMGRKDDRLGGIGLHDTRRSQCRRAGQCGLQDITTFHEIQRPQRIASC